MKPPTTPEEVLAFHKLCAADPARCVDITTRWIADDPTDSHAYYDRHFAWTELGEPERAMDDLNEVFRLDPSQIVLKSRGDLYRQIGDLAHASEDYANAEAMEPKRWAADAFPLIYQADVHARLGDEAAALACCSRLPDDFWTPGHNGLPPGGKAEIADELKRRASAARAANNAS